MSPETFFLRISRRSLLGGAAAGAFASVAPVLLRRASAASHGPRELKVVLAEVDRPGVMLRTYNRVTPGPTLSAFPGEAIEVNVINMLEAQPPEEFCPDDINGFHAANTTNLHTHGLHVSPEKASDGRDSDNIFLNIVPDGQEVPQKCDDENLRRQTAEFSFELPGDHPSGTFWYHAHKHGSTAQQVGNGLVGPLIVRDTPGVMPSYIENAREDILMIQMRDISEDTPAPGDSGGKPQLVLVDPSGEGGGEKQPTIVLAPGSVRRWRIINAAPRADTFVDLNVTGPEGSPPLEVYQIAFDGLTYEKRVRIDPSDSGPPWQNPAALAPGNRTDLMIRVPRDAPEGLFSLVAERIDADLLHGAPAAARGASEAMTLNIRIQGEPVDDEWSDNDDLPGGGPLLEPIRPEEIRGLRNVEFHLVPSTKDAPAQFLIDGVPFSGKIMQEMRKGTAERWHITNVNTFTHPFHIHVNPFFVTHINGVELEAGNPLRRWQDTVALPVSPGGDAVGSITMESRFVRFTGKFVIHCHILEHEDEGMMQAVEVIG